MAGEVDGLSADKTGRRFGWKTGVAVFVAVSYLSLTIGGFCFKELRFFSDDVIMARALISASKNSKSLNVAEDMESAQAYIKANPSCCSILPRSDPLMNSIFFNIVFGRAQAGVHVELPVSKPTADGTRYESYEIFICGKNVASHGMLLD